MTKEVVWPNATRVLAADPAFGPVVEAVGPVRLAPPRDSPFAALARAVVYQQLAGAAASAIHGRLVEALGGRVTPEAVTAAGDAELRGAGLSAAKLRALRDLAEKVQSGEVALDGWEGRADDEIVDALVRVRGVGPWTARMFLMAQLRRPDVWPVGDRGVRAGWARIHGLDELPDRRTLEQEGERLRPWRSAAAWYCWRAVETVAPVEPEA